MKQLVHSHTANEFNVVPFFMKSWRRVYYISLTAGAISRTQIYIVQNILYHRQQITPQLIDGGKMWDLFKYVEILKGTIPIYSRFHFKHWRSAHISVVFFSSINQKGNRKKSDTQHPHCIHDLQHQARLNRISHLWQI